MVSSSSSPTRTPQMYVGLLRAVNIGGKNRIAMARLRQAVKETIGITVDTYIQTGNLIFQADGEEHAKKIMGQIEETIENEFGFAVESMFRSLDQLLKVREESVVVITNSSSSTPNPHQVHIGFLNHPLTPDAINRLDYARCPHSKLLLSSSQTEYYLHSPAGMSKSRFTSTHLEKTSDTRLTFRNLNTVDKLIELLSISSMIIRS